MHASHDNVTVSHFVAARDIRTLSSLSNIKIQFLMASLVTLIDVCKTSITIMGKLLPGNPKDCLPTKYWCHSFIMKLYFQSGSFSWKPNSTIIRKLRNYILIENWIIQAFFKFMNHKYVHTMCYIYIKHYTIQPHDFITWNCWLISC